MSTNTTQTYLDLITSEHSNQANFKATISAVTDVLVQIQTLLASMIDLFDLNLSPVGNQLDIIGEWVGVSRKIAAPITGIFFTWDDTSRDGWDFGTWQPTDGPSSIVVLPDSAYLTLILARIAANNWDGTTEGAYVIWENLLPAFNLLIQDHQNMSFTVAIQGAVPDSLTVALLTGGYLPLKPEGVRITEYIIPVDTNPLFAWDCNSTGLQGWDSGSWGVELQPT